MLAMTANGPYRLDSTTGAGRRISRFGTKHHCLGRNSHGTSLVSFFLIQSGSCPRRRACRPSLGILAPTRTENLNAFNIHYFLTDRNCCTAA